MEQIYYLEVGDIIMWNESYWEIDNVNDNQLFVGKDPAYPYETNPLNPGLDNYGSNYSIICTAHYVPSDKVSYYSRKTIRYAII
jgi:hypothetical protein